MAQPARFGAVRRMALSALAGAALLGLFPGAQAGARPAGARSTRTLSGVDGYSVTLPATVSGKVAADPTTGRIFIAGVNGTAALTASGGFIAMDTALNDATEVLAAVGKIWVVRSYERTLTRIDPSTLATETWSPSAGPTGLFGLAYAGGAVWSTSPNSINDTVLHRLDPATGTWTSTVTTFDGVGILAASPQAPDTLVLGSGDSGSYHLKAWNVSASTPVAGPERRGEPGYLSGLAISPDGTKVFASRVEAGTTLAVYDLSDLSLSAQQPAEQHGLHSVASSTASGGTVATLVQRAESHVDAAPDVTIYRNGSSTSAIASKVLDPAVEYLDRGSIGFSGNGRTVLVTSYSPAQERAHLHFLPIDPSIRSVSPAVVGTRGGARVSVTGTSLGLTSAVSIGTTVASASASSPTAVSFDAPAMAAGSYPLALVWTGGSAASSSPLRVAELGPFRAGTTFVERQFVDVLGRVPTSTERTTWNGRLLASTAPGALPAGLVTTPSLGLYRAPMIRMYRAIYLQTPSLSTLTYWADRYRTGTKLSAIADYFAVSRYGSMPSRNFVDQVFRAVLGRPATSSELTFWSNQMKAGMTRGQVLVFFSESTDNIARQVPVVRLSELYLGMLRRPPTVPETTAGLAASGGLATVAAQIMGSAPYAGRYPNG